MTVNLAISLMSEVLPTWIGEISDKLRLEDHSILKSAENNKRILYSLFPAINVLVGNVYKNEMDLLNFVK
jgi:hypothetical protein